MGSGLLGQPALGREGARSSGSGPAGCQGERLQVCGGQHQWVLPTLLGHLGKGHPLAWGQLVGGSTGPTGLCSSSISQPTPGPAPGAGDRVGLFPIARLNPSAREHFHVRCQGRRLPEPDVYGSGRSQRLCPDGSRGRGRSGLSPQLPTRKRKPGRSTGERSSPWSRQVAYSLPPLERFGVIVRRALTVRVVRMTSLRRCRQCVSCPLWCLPRAQLCPVSRCRCPLTDEGREACRMLCLRWTHPGIGSSPQLLRASGRDPLHSWGN